MLSIKLFGCGDGQICSSIDMLLILSEFLNHLRLFPLFLFTLFLFLVSLSNDETKMDSGNFWNICTNLYHVAEFLKFGQYPA